LLSPNLQVQLLFPAYLLPATSDLGIKREVPMTLFSRTDMMFAELKCTADSQSAVRHELNKRKKVRCPECPPILIVGQ